MYNGDQARKKVPMYYGFRLPSAADNRPLKGSEFWEKAHQTVFVSAFNAGDWEMQVSGGEVVQYGDIDPQGFLIRWLRCGPQWDRLMIYLERFGFG